MRDRCMHCCTVFPMHESTAVFASILTPFCPIFPSSYFDGTPFATLSLSLYLIPFQASSLSLYYGTGKGRGREGAATDSRREEVEVGGGGRVFLLPLFSLHILTSGLHFFFGGAQHTVAFCLMKLQFITKIMETDDLSSNWAISHPASSSREMRRADEWLKERNLSVCPPASS